MVVVQYPDLGKDGDRTKVTSRVTTRRTLQSTPEAKTSAIPVPVYESIVFGT